MFTQHYDDWRKSRLNTVINLLGIDFFRGKRVLEVGAGYGDLGYELSKLGANVTFSEGRLEHLAVIKQRYPEFEARLDNCEEILDIPHYDIIVDFGLIYHLENLKQHIINMCEHCDYLLLEGIVAHESDDPDYYRVKSEYGYDQSLTTKGTIASPKYIENILTSCNMSFQRYDLASLNSSFHIYDWKIGDKADVSHRRFWIAKKI